MSVENIAGILIIVGSLVFMAAAFPIGGEVYGEDDPKRQMEIISSNRRGWSISQFLFAASSLVVAAGFLMFSNAADASPPRTAFIVSASLLLVGAIFWSAHVAWRALQPERVLTKYGTVSIEFVSFVGFGILTAMGLALFGIGILQRGETIWLAYVVLILTSILSLQMIVFRGGYIPLLFYFPTLIAGLVMVL